MDPHEALHAELGERYELRELLAEGGMGTLYLAHDRRLDRQVAIKTIHPGLAGGTAPRRFEQEIRITARLQHAHILPLLDSGVAHDVVYYIMPYVDGETLEERLARDGRLKVEYTLRLAEQLCAALDYAHRQGVVHRDIKPANILLSSGQAILMDFGVAHAVDTAAGDRLTGTGLAIGSPAYMSPEQALASPEIDGRSDITAWPASSTRCWPARGPSKGPRTRWSSRNSSPALHPRFARSTTTSRSLSTRPSRGRSRESPPTASRAPVISPRHFADPSPPMWRRGWAKVRSMALQKILSPTAVSAPAL